MHETLTRLIHDRASGRCEYCQLPSAVSSIPFEIDHIIAKKHGGKTIASNLALACFYCNSFKGPNIAGFDPDSRKLVGLFHPRRHSWPHHFRWNGPLLIGRTAVGRATIAVLEINDLDAVAARQALLEEGVSFQRLPKTRPR